MHLWEVQIVDDLVKKAKNEISETFEKNLYVVELALHVYDDYLFLLKEKQKVDQWLNEGIYTKE